MKKKGKKHRSNRIEQLLNSKIQDLLPDSLKKLIVTSQLEEELLLREIAYEVQRVLNNEYVDPVGKSGILANVGTKEFEVQLPKEFGDRFQIPLFVSH